MPSRRLCFQVPANDRELVQCLDLTAPEGQSRWSPLLHRLFRIVERVWTVTSKVVSLGPQGEDKTAAHEIARAYEVLGDGDDEEDQGHIGLLSGSWRATKEAGDLLAAIMIAPLKIEGQSVWTKQEVDQAGRLFLTWLHEVRHRGTFSKIAPAFGSVVDVVRRTELKDLVREWLDVSLTQRTPADDRWSLTRSGGATFPLSDGRPLCHTLFWLWFRQMPTYWKAPSMPSWSWPASIPPPPMKPRFTL